MERGKFFRGSPPSEAPAIPGQEPEEPVAKQTPVRRSGLSMGDVFARLGSGFGDEGPVGYDEYMRAVENKAAAQARERARLGLESADFVDYGCEGEPKPPGS